MLNLDVFSGFRHDNYEVSHQKVCIINLTCHGRIRGIKQFEAPLKHFMIKCLFVLQYKCLVCFVPTKLPL